MSRPLRAEWRAWAVSLDILMTDFMHMAPLYRPIVTKLQAKQWLKSF